jgi:hypothetical protein
MAMTIEGQNWLFDFLRTANQGIRIDSLRFLGTAAGHGVHIPDSYLPNCPIVPMGNNHVPESPAARFLVCVTGYIINRNRSLALQRNF